MLSATSTVARRWLLAFALYVTVVAFAAGSSSVVGVAQATVGLRWVALFVLAAVALVAVGIRLRERSVLPGLWFAPLPGALLALAAVSAAWSLDPSLTLRRTTSLAILLLAAGALGAVAALDRREARRLLVAVVAAAATVAVLGLIVLAWSRTLALQGLGGAGELRYRGFGANPNTVPMLYAVSLPLAFWLWLAADTYRARVAAAGATVLFAGSVVAAQSRGALLACLFGASLVALTLVSGGLRKAGALTTILVVFLAGNTLRGVDSGPAYSAEVIEAYEARQREADFAGAPAFGSGSPGKPGSKPGRPGTGTGFGTGFGTGTGTGTGTGAKPGAQTPEGPELLTEVSVRPEDEIGHPLLGLTNATAGSGRAAAWRGAFADVRERPLLGTGFGTEGLAFTDRWYFFQGFNPENAYLGLLLQLGAAGLALFLLLGFALLLAGVTSIRRARGEERGIVAATLGAVVAGGVLMLSQSYVYSVGNVATVSFWTCAFILAAVAGRPSFSALRLRRGSGQGALAER